jgi:hypothetical protein
MAYIFLDESGDLGFDFDKEGTSKYFIITFLFVSNKRPIEKVVRKTHGELKNRHKMRGGVLHCFREKPITRRRLLERLSKKECNVMTIYLNKTKVFTRLQDEKNVLYNYVTNLLLDRIFTKKLIPLDEEIILVASRKDTNKFLNENFRNYLQAKLKIGHKIEIKVEIRTPHEEKCLQAVDFASWAIFRKLERGDDTYNNYFKKIIAEENPLFP